MQLYKKGKAYIYSYYDIQFPTPHMKCQLLQKGGAVNGTAPPKQWTEVPEGSCMSCLELQPESPGGKSSSGVRTTIRHTCRGGVHAALEAGDAGFRAFHVPY